MNVQWRKVAPRKGDYVAARALICLQSNKKFQSNIIIVP